ncbi:hypothetical protein ACE6H2_010529 [Prunus campanulata]
MERSSFALVAVLTVTALRDELCKPLMGASHPSTPSTPSTPLAQRCRQLHRSSHQSSPAAIDAIFIINDDDVLENRSRDLARWENPRTSYLVFDVA